MAKKNKSEIPVGTQFSPNLINLPEFIKAIVKHSGSREVTEWPAHDLFSEYTYK